VASALDSSLQSAIIEIPECVAAGYVDMTTGMPLSVRTVDANPQEVSDLVSAATADLFRGANVSSIEDLFMKARGLTADSQQYFQEIIVFSDTLLQMFLRCKKNTNHVLVFVSRKSANVGMVIAKSRIALSLVDGSL
jgi:hypothetical protein